MPTIKHKKGSKPQNVARKLTLHPLSTDQAIAAALQIKPKDVAKLEAKKRRAKKKGQPKKGWPA